MLAVTACLLTAVPVMVTTGPTATTLARRSAVEVPVTAMNQSLGPANNSPALSADPTDRRFLVMANRLDAPDFGCALQVSGDGGHSWTPVQPVAALPAGVDRCYAPEVAFDGEGTLFYLFVGLAGRGNQPVGAFLVRSVDRTRTFSAPEQVLGAANFGVRMAIDAAYGTRGRLHLVWLHASSEPPLGGFGTPPNPILTAHSDDGGRTFSTPLQVSDAGRFRVVAPVLALGPNHGVHVGYYDLGDDAVDYQGLAGAAWAGTWAVVVTSSVDGGVRFAPGQVVDGGVVPAQRVMLVFTMPPPALAAGTDRLCAGWTDARHGDEDVMVRCATDGGRTWSPTVRVNDDLVGNGRSQYLPRLSGAGGRIDAVYYDRRADPANLDNRVSYTSSTDGRRFAPPLDLTTQPSSSRIGQEYQVPSADGLVEMGSRLGLLSTNVGAVAAWADTRNSTFDSTGQDIFAAIVATRPQWPWPSGMTLGSVAAAMGGMAAGGALALRRRRGGA